LRTRRGTLAREEIKARQAGDTRRAARLAHRGGRVGRELARREAIAGNARDVLAGAAHRRHATGEPLGERERLERQRWLDHQATLRRGVVPGPRADAATYRDYPRLAPLAGLDRASYAALAPGEQRE